MAISAVDDGRERVVPGTLAGTSAAPATAGDRLETLRGRTCYTPKDKGFGRIVDWRLEFSLKISAVE